MADRTADLIRRLVDALDGNGGDLKVLRNEADEWLVGRATSLQKICDRCFGEGCMPGSATQICRKCDGAGAVAAHVPDGVLGTYKDVTGESNG